MLIALIIVAVYLVIASLVVLNSVLETERDRLVAKDMLVIALVGAVWPAAGCALLCQALIPKARAFLPARP